jgi:hypothetical protein
MTLQWAGPVLAVATFATIGFGHMAVRKINYLYGTKPTPFVSVLGLLFLFFSLRVTGNIASAALGIIGMTTLWDSYELIRQEERVRRGHAPVNPNRPVEPRSKRR